MSIRRATTEDIAILNRIARDCFSDVLTWRKPRVAMTRWWQALLDDPSGVVWVFCDGGTVVGFCHLVTDQQRHYAMQRQHRGGPLTLMYVLSKYPLTAARAVWRQVGEAVIPRNRIEMDLAVVEIMDTALWIRPIAVCPSVQGRGIGGRLLAFAKERAAEKGSVLCASVKRGNTRAVSLYARAGFREVVMEGPVVTFAYGSA
jgi:GNAT superfamily N-acetyltransferase